MALAKRIDPSTLAFLLPEEALLPREEALLSLAAAIAADGHQKQLERTLHHLIETGVDATRVREALLQTYLFAGLARAEQALFALDKAQHEGPKDPLAAIMKPPEGGGAKRRATSGAASIDEGPSDAEGRVARGREALAAIAGPDARKIEDQWRRAAPELATWALEDAGRILARGPLSPRTRSLLAIACHVPLDAPHALKTHVRGARAAGIGDETLWALHDLLVRVFDDGPVLQRAREAFEQVLGRRDTGEDASMANPLMWD